VEPVVRAVDTATTRSVPLAGPMPCSTITAPRWVNCWASNTPALAIPSSVCALARDRGELLRDQLGGSLARFVRPREPHPRDDTTQLVGDGRRFLGCGVRLRKQQPGAEGEVTHGDVAAARIACDVGPPVHRGELHEGGAALAGRAVHLVPAEDLDLAVVEPTAQPARAPCARRSSPGCAGSRTAG